MSLTDIHLVHVHPIFEPSSYPEISRGIVPYTCSRLTRLLDLNIITTHLPLAHLPILCKRPILQTITPLPLHPIMRILILIPELDRDLVLEEREQLLAKSVVLLFLPFLGQEVFDCGGSGKERVAVSPDAVGGVRLSDDFWVPRRSGGAVNLGKE